MVSIQGCRPIKEGAKGLSDPGSEGLPRSMPNMTGRPGCRTMEMNGGSFASYLACTPCVPLFCTYFNRGGHRRPFRLPGESRDHCHSLYGGTFTRSCTVSTRVFRTIRTLFCTTATPLCASARGLSLLGSERP